MIKHNYEILLIDRANGRNVIETSGDTYKVIQYLNSNRYQVIRVKLAEEKRK